MGGYWNEYFTHIQVCIKQHHMLLNHLLYCQEEEKTYKIIFVFFNTAGELLFDALPIMHSRFEQVAPVVMEAFSSLEALRDVVSKTSCY